jgi:hypothetical protein
MCTTGHNSPIMKGEWVELSILTGWADVWSEELWQPEQWELWAGTFYPNWLSWRVEWRAMTAWAVRAMGWNFLSYLVKLTCWVKSYDSLNSESYGLELSIPTGWADVWSEELWQPEQWELWAGTFCPTWLSWRVEWRAITAWAVRAMGWNSRGAPVGSGNSEVSTKLPDSE